MRAMSTVTFDTLKFAKRLEAAGASAQLAEAMAEAQQEAFSEALQGQLATKTDTVSYTHLDVYKRQIPTRRESFRLSKH